MFKKGSPWVIMTLTILFFLIALITRVGVGLVCAPEEEGIWSLTWGVYEGVDVDNETIDSWHSSGTIKLIDDDDGPGYDVEVEASLQRCGTDYEWFCEGGTAEVDDWDQLTDMSSNMSFDCLVVSSIYIGEVSYNGAYEEDKIFIISDPVSTTLVHEVGHMAGLYDIYDEEEYERIMYYEGIDSGCKVHTDCPIHEYDERAAFEAGNGGGPEK